MTTDEQTAAIQLLAGLWPDWKATAAQKDLWRETFQRFTLNAVATILKRHRKEQREGRDFSPNLKTVSMMLDSFREYRAPDAISEKWQQLYHGSTRLQQALLDDVMCRRSLGANRFESARDRYACETRLDAAQRDIAANPQGDTMNEAEQRVALVLDEMDTFARQSR
ncbi:MAG: hypothetical protein ABFE01_20665 [Phycisphaerales bacterium]